MDFPCSSLGKLYVSASACFWREIQPWKGAFLSPWAIPGAQLSTEGNPDPPLRLERSRPLSSLLRLATLWNRERRMKGKARKYPIFLYFIQLPSIILHFGSWLSGVALVRSDGHFAHDWELQPCELEEAPEKCPTSSVQEVLGEPASQVMPGQVCPLQRWPVVDVTQWADTELLRQPLATLWSKDPSASSWQWKDHINPAPARSLAQGVLPSKRKSRIPPLPLTWQLAPRNSGLVA